MRKLTLPIVMAVVLLLTGCSPAPGAASEPYLTRLDDVRPVALAAGERLDVVATTSVVADVVSQIGGDEVDLVQLIPIGVDPHAFEPTPGDARTLAEADLIFVNGFGLEAFMADLIEQAGSGSPVISVSEGIAPLPFEGEHEGEEHEGEEHEGEEHEGEEHEGEEHEGEEHEGEAHEHGGADPHTWFDPNNVIHWTERIEAALSAIDPAHAEGYAARAETYRAELVALDGQIRADVSRIPPERRRLVTDHEELGYFADEYGFTVVGTIIPGTSSLAEPSAAELADLLDAVRAEGVPAVFVTSVVNPTVVESFADDAGVRIVTLYGHSLTSAEGPAPTYLDLMRYNAETIAAALTP